MMAAEEETREIEAEAKAEAERIAEAKEVDTIEQAGPQSQADSQHEGMPKLVRAPVVRRRKPKRVKGPILLYVVRVFLVNCISY